MARMVFGLGALSDMGKRDPLNSHQIARALEDLPGWVFTDDRLCKTFRFDGYRNTIRCVNRIAREAEAADHHPTMTVGYNELTVTTCTHTAGNKVTPMDVALAASIEACYAEQEVR